MSLKILIVVFCCTFACGCKPQAPSEETQTQIAEKSIDSDEPASFGPAPGTVSISLTEKGAQQNSVPSSFTCKRRGTASIAESGRRYTVYLFEYNGKLIRIPSWDIKTLSGREFDGGKEADF